MKQLTPSSPAKPRVQRGGTALGIVIGVVVSVLVVAAGAIWYAKTQSPVVNRVTSKESLSAAEEAKKNKDWNPNSSLFGKPPPVSLGAMAASAASAATAASGAVAAETLVDKKPEKPPVPSSSVAPANSGKPSPADPIADLVKSKAQGQSAVITGQVSKQPEAKSEESTGVYYVQAGAFKQADDANAQKAKLAILGVSTKVFEHEQSGKPVFRVRAGPFSRMDEAEGMKSKLEKAGFDAALVKAPK